MEKRLAEFRARRLAQNADKMSERSQSEEQTAESVDKRSQKSDFPRSEEQTAAESEAQSETAGCQQPERTENNPAHSSQSQPRRDWMLDSALGQWLASRQYVVSNVILLKVLLWLVLLGLFVELEFGLAFFVLSLFYWLYEGLRSPAPRQPGEMSAYSVFNPDCQPLLGSLTAEQLEGEMGYRPLANR
ncbi:SAYSvFN domain-containing protein 1 [Salarias fasciatus]|uniref:SAYSvFN domain-containing protein n=1 Tax=Salarias fasciatus TaxID=181472 RepID=A0A672J083_SALFA|nr:SAYSvFN domain-containing protein 1 [Salarias fasciatus]